MAVLFCSTDDDAESWRLALARRVPDCELRIWPEIGDPGGIEAALVWKPPAGLLRSLPNLKLIQSLGAGVDALLADPTLPDLPLCRMVDPSMTFAMAEYVLASALKYSRYFDVYARQQRHGEWRLRLPRPPEQWTVGIMGTGVLGSAAAAMLGRHGFRVIGWSRSGRPVDGMTVHGGEAGLGPFLAACDMLVCLLPLTEDTRAILARPLFERLKPGCRLIHVGRGAQLVETDLTLALDLGWLSAATLDVVPVEPLPEGHPFWRDPRIDITPHGASYSLPESGALIVAENLRRVAEGRPLLHVVERDRGY